MAANYTSTVYGTASNPTSGTTLVEEYLVTKLLEEQEFVTPLVNSKYASDKNLPERVGQWAKFTRRQKLRLPEKATEGSDPNSYASVAYEQILAPIEFHNDHTAISTVANLTSWLDLAKDFKDLTFEAIKRYINRYTQAAFLMGRVKPGHRNSSGLTDGSSDYPNFWESAEQVVTLYGQSFTFQSATRFYGGRKTQFNALDVDKDFVTMDDFRRMRAWLRTRGARKFGKKYIAVISEGMMNDLERSDEYFEYAIRNGPGQNALIDGQVADYAGFAWVVDDEPWKLSSDDSVKYVATGRIHVAQVFGMDAFGALRLGGQQSLKPAIKVQDISTTGTLTTMGYLFPFQSLILNDNWAATLTAPVRDYDVS